MDEEAMGTVGKRIAAGRKARGWSQQQLADKIKVGRSTVANWETDKIIPEAPSLLTMADELNVNAKWLLMLDDSPTPYASIDPDEALLLNAFRNLSEASREALRGYLGYLASQQSSEAPTSSRPFPKAKAK